MAKELTEEEKKKALFLIEEERKKELAKTLSLTNPQDRNQNVITANDISDYDNMSDYERGLALAKYDADVDARNNFNYEASGPQIQPPIRKSKTFSGTPSQKDLAQHDFEVDAKNNFNYEAVNDKPRESTLKSLKEYYDSKRKTPSETNSDSNITVAQPGSKDDTTLQSFSNPSTVSEDLGKLYSSYDPSKNTRASNYFTGNAAREYLDRTEQIDVNPRPKVVNALDPFTERINGPREEKAKQVKAYAVSLFGREDKNKTFNSLKEAQDYFKAQGGKGAIATFSDTRPDEKPKSIEALQEAYRQKYHSEQNVWRPEVLAKEAKRKADIKEEDIKTDRLNPQARAEEFANAKLSEKMTKKEKDIETQALKQKLTETGKKAWAEAKKARDAENAANSAKFEKFKEGVSEKDDALVAYNQFNKSQGILSKAYNKALSNGDYGAAINLQQIMQQRGAKIPTEMGARQEYFKKLIPERKQLSIELETEKRKQDAYLLSQLEQNRLANQKYNESRNASNPDAQFNNYSNANPFNEKYRLF